jgi:hypothetical protein
MVDDNQGENIKGPKMHGMTIGMISGAVFLANIPFGYWRIQKRKYSLRWLLAVHLPISFVIVMRLYSGIGWKPLSFPIFMSTYCAGQYLGGKLYGYLNKD